MFNYDKEELRFQKVPKCKIDKFLEDVSKETSYEDKLEWLDDRYEGKLIKILYLKNELDNAVSNNEINIADETSYTNWINLNDQDNLIDRRYLGRILLSTDKLIYLHQLTDKSYKEFVNRLFLKELYTCYLDEIWYVDVILNPIDIENV